MGLDPLLEGVSRDRPSDVPWRCGSAKICCGTRIDTAPQEANTSKPTNEYSSKRAGGSQHTTGKKSSNHLRLRAPKGKKDKP